MYFHAQGDSGGPLIKHENDKSKQVGIVSWGLAPCGERSGANVYTLVASYVNWIESNIADNWLIICTEQKKFLVKFENQVFYLSFILK